MKKFLAGYESRILALAEHARFTTLRMAVLALVGDFLKSNGYEPVTWEGPSASFETNNMKGDIKLEFQSPSRKSRTPV